ncbi:unnamed protein product [Kuraishia capsulata CBS 1993]|uniref:GTP:AMP phosphotransferase, mitochondrial n=1 Tax=Kuraishia capsulata CBS 1993 TaxID=1382522 RepID=W6MSC0_9ASCO|nr:uncharacterized protein KUCA_T00005689001 [Kuraishia capsulata CBS 1993]CDK29696.1 unnamed protein product [Kuraishia capsulata CBS 1993]
MLRPLRLLLLGAPGSGKGTQTSRLLKQFPTIEAFSTGDLLRREVAAKSEIGKLASNYISQGKLFPDELIVDLTISALSSHQVLTSDSSWLLDGFPRTLTQAKILDQKLNSTGAPVSLVVELDVPESVILERIENRWVHVPSGRVYNLQYNPPKVPGIDDVTGQPLAKRDDDNVEVFQKRLDTYRQTMDPIKTYYSEKGILQTVSGETSDIIFPKLVELIKSKFAA